MVKDGEDQGGERQSVCERGEGEVGSAGAAC